MSYQRDTYHAKDGSVWHVLYECPPIPVRGCDWIAFDQDGDGAPDGGCDSVTAATKPEVIAEIERFVAEERGE